MVIKMRRKTLFVSGATCVSDRHVTPQLGNPQAQNPNVTQCCFKKEERRPVDLIIALTAPILIVFFLHSTPSSSIRKYREMFSLLGEAFYCRGLLSETTLAPSDMITESADCKIRSLQCFNVPFSISVNR